MVALELFNFLHFLGLAFGLGGATFAFVISRKAEKDKDVGKALMKIMPSIVKFIWIGMLLLIISGIALPFFVTWPLNRQMLIIKHVLVAWIVVIGVVIGTRMKKMKNLAPVGRLHEKPSPKFIKTQKQIKFFSTINLILWYLVTLLSVFV